MSTDVTITKTITLSAQDEFGSSLNLVYDMETDELEARITVEVTGARIPIDWKSLVRFAKEIENV